MTPQYKPVRFPMVAYQNMILKQKKIEENLRLVTRKRNIHVPFTKLLEVITETPMLYTDEELIRKFGIKMRKWR